MCGSTLHPKTNLVLLAVKYQLLHSFTHLWCRHRLFLLFLRLHSFILRLWGCSQAPPWMSTKFQYLELPKFDYSQQQKHLVFPFAFSAIPFKRTPFLLHTCLVSVFSCSPIPVFLSTPESQLFKKIQGSFIKPYLEFQQLSGFTKCSLALEFSAIGNCLFLFYSASHLLG